MHGWPQGVSFLTFSSSKWNKIGFKKLPIYNQYYLTKFNDLGIILFRRRCFIRWGQNMWHLTAFTHSRITTRIIICDIPARKTAVTVFLWRYGGAPPCSHRKSCILRVWSKLLDVFGGCTEVHSAYQEWYRLFFILVLREGKLRRLKFFPGYAGAPRITADACPVYVHGDAGDNTDDPGAMVRDDPCCDPWMCESPFSDCKVLKYSRSAFFLDTRYRMFAFYIWHHLGSTCTYMCIFQMILLQKSLILVLHSQPLTFLGLCIIESSQHD